MKSHSTLLSLLPALAILAAGCQSDAPNPLAPRDTVLSPLVLGGGCPFPMVTSGVLSPIRDDNSSDFNLGRTVPVKIRVSDCVTGAAINTLSPRIALLWLGDPVTPVNVVVSSSNADDGNRMRNAGEGQYIYNLSTTLSQFDAGVPLTTGRYQLTISSPGDVADVVVEFTLR